MLNRDTASITIQSYFELVLNLKSMGFGPVQMVNVLELDQ